MTAPGAAGAPPLHLVLHVPKCAGKTLERHFEAHMPAGAFVKPLRRRPPARWVLPRHAPDAVADPARVRVASSQQIGRSLETRFAGREILRTALIRDPLSHGISYYNFRMMRYVAMGWGTYDFDTHVRSEPRNRITRFLLWSYLEIPWPRLVTMSGEEAFALVARHFRDFWFVGSYRLCDELTAELAPVLDIPAVAVRQNDRAEMAKTIVWDELKAADLDPALRARIVADNAVDQALFDSFAEARHGAGSVRLQPPPRSARLAPLGHELARPLHEARRRIGRGYW